MNSSWRAARAWGLAAQTMVTNHFVNGGFQLVAGTHSAGALRRSKPPSGGLLIVLWFFLYFDFLSFNVINFRFFDFDF